MWILFWKQYAGCKAATFISVVGALLRYAAVLCLVNELIPAGIICISVGIVLHFCAEAVAFNKWKRLVKQKGVDQRVRQGDIQAAIGLYNSRAENRTIKYIESLNPDLGAQIKTMVENNNKK